MRGTEHQKPKEQEQDEPRQNQVREWSQAGKGQFAEEEIRKAKEHTKRCLNSL